jgi:hypothetical protein
VGEIDKTENAVNHRVAERDKGIDAAQDQTVDELLNKDIQKQDP